MQENGEFFAIFSLEDARVASYSLRAPHNATSVIGDPAEVRGKNICQTTGKSKTDGGLSRGEIRKRNRGMKMVIYLHISKKSSNFVRGIGIINLQRRMERMRQINKQKSLRIKPKINENLHYQNCRIL